VALYVPGSLLCNPEVVPCCSSCSKVEVYNEPDLSHLGCKSTGIRTNASDPACMYFKMFAAASNAVKKVSKALQIGGPATSQGRWLQDLCEYCTEHNVALDFLTTHR